MPTRSESPDVVAILVAGHVHDQWSTYDIESDLLTPADRWNVTLGFDAGSRVPEIITEGAEALMMVGEDQVMRGLIDDITHRVVRPAPSLLMSGRDGAAVLVDCSAPIFVAKEISLDDVIAQIVRPLGVKRIRIDADKATRSDKVNIDPGIKAWDALQQAAEANGLWPWFEPDGTLVVGGPDYTTEPVAHLIMLISGEGNNVLSISHQRSIAGRYSEVTVLGQAHGTARRSGQHNIKAVAKDTGIQQYRPLVVIEGDIETEDAARTRARKIVADGRLNGETLTVTMRGHRTPGGKLWTPGQRVRVQSEPHDIDDIYFLMARKFTGGVGRQTLTELTLKEDGVWVLDARKKRKHKRKVGKKGAKLTPTVLDLK